jgi:hypothetical protein
MDISIIQRLEEELDGHLGRYTELIDFLEQEKRYLLNLDLDGLLVLSRAKEELARRIIRGSEGFKEHLSMAASMLGFDAGSNPTLAEVAGRCPLPFSNRLADGAMTLSRLKNQILRENEQARRYTEESLGLVTDSINILSGANQLKGDSYGNDGKKDKGVKKSLPSKLSRDV